MLKNCALHIPPEGQTMKYDFQRASFMKRLPAWMLDMILLITLVTGFVWVWSNAFEITPHLETINAIENQYKAEYDGQLSMSIDEYQMMTEEEKVEKLTEEERTQLNEAILAINEKLFQNETYATAYGKMVSNLFSIIALSFLCAYFILEFLIPLWLKNGQTLGKKCFGIALMRKDGVKVTPFIVFTRTILGKCSVELMVPIMLYVMLGGSIVSVFAILAFFLAQIIVPIATYNKTAIHDLLACTVEVDLASQMIFDSVEDMEAYNAELHVDKAFEDQE